MQMKNSTSVLVLVASCLLLGFGFPKNIEKKVRKVVEKTFSVEGVSFDTLALSDDLNKSLPVEITGDNFHKIYKNDELLGYVFTDQAPSKTAQFDYMVIFNIELKVVNSKVLVYREEYGGEIGSKRWLKQFLGLGGNDRVDCDTNIDAISGATISVRSMTYSIDKLLQTIGKLQENKIL